MFSLIIPKIRFQNPNHRSKNCISTWNNLNYRFRGKEIRYFKFLKFGFRTVLSDPTSKEWNTKIWFKEQYFLRNFIFCKFFFYFGLNIVNYLKLIIGNRM